MKMLKSLKLMIVVLLGTSLMLVSATVSDKQDAKIADAASVLRDFGKMKESIPHSLLAETHGIIIVPKLINAGFVIGGERGKGVAMVRDANGKWSDPVFVTITGGSFGFQVGVQSVDLVLVFRHSETLRKIGKGTFTLGGDVSVAAGPVGRSSSANTDYKLSAEAYSYSRSRGLFAGLTVKGAELHVDAKANTSFYGDSYSAATLFSDTKSPTAGVKELKATLVSL